MCQTYFVLMQDDGNGEDQSHFVAANAPQEALDMHAVHIKNEMDIDDPALLKERRVFKVPTPEKLGVMEWNELTSKVSP